MAIPSGTIFSSTPAVVSEKKSALNNARHEGYSIADVADAISDIQLNDVAYKAATISYVEDNIIDQYHTLKVDTLNLNTASGTTTNILLHDTDVFIVNLIGGAGNVDIDILLPASTATGRLMTFICDSTVTATETVTIASSDNINGAANVVLNSAYSVLRIISTGTEWLRID